MTWKDKLELGLKNDAPYRKDNLPEQQVRGPEIESGPGRSPVVPSAIDDAMDPNEPSIPDDRPQAGRAGEKRLEDDRLSEGDRDPEMPRNSKRPGEES